MLPHVLQVCEGLGYRVFQRGSYNLNIVNIRSSNSKAGRFDDAVTFSYKDSNGAWMSHWWPATVDPGRYWLKHPMRREGTAIMVPGQYPKLWKLGLHNKSKGDRAYKAFEQSGSIKVYRDNTLDEILDYDPATIQQGMYFINMHASDSDPWDESDRDRTDGKVNKWSAGCTVFAVSSHFRQAYLLGEQSAALYGNSFTSTLITEDQLKGA